MVGGKQKRAAKHKRWVLSQIKPPQKESSDGEEKLEYPDGDDTCVSDSIGPVPLKVRQEVLRHRQKKAKRSGKDNWIWITRKVDRLCRAVDHWPSWPFTFALCVVLYILVFFLIRSLIQMFAPEGYAGMDRAHLYNGFKNIAPKPIYKMIRLMDYLFTSRELSFRGMYNIIYPPEEYYTGQGHVPHSHSQFFARS